MAMKSVSRVGNDATESLTPEQVRAFTKAASWEVEEIANAFRLINKRDIRESADPGTFETIHAALTQRLEAVGCALSLLPYHDNLTIGGANMIRGHLLYARECEAEHTVSEATVSGGNHV